MGLFSSAKGRARRMAKKAERTVVKTRKRQQRSDNKQKRIQVRQDGRTGRVKSRQDTRKAIKVAESEADKVAYENGITPNKHGLGAILEGASDLIGSFTGNSRPPADLPYVPGETATVNADGRLSASGTIMGIPILYVVLGGLGLAFLMKKRGRA